MEIIPNVHRIPGLKRANAYLLLGETLTLVDTGMAGDTGAILGAIHELGRKPADLVRIIVTHHHTDHTGSLAALKERTGAQVLAHPADAPYISGERPRPLPKHLFLQLLFRLMRTRSHRGETPVDATIQDGDRLALLGGATVIHVPGHTPGSIVLHFPAERLLITGDAIIVQGGKPRLPPSFFSQDAEQAIASARRLAMLDFETLCGGHGDPITSGAAGQLGAMLEKLT